jgi:polyisoprenoid-binding protein YceI
MARRLHCELDEKATVPMNTKLLQWFGTLSLLALVGGSVAALALVKQRTHITFSDEANEQTHGPDPVALLGEDVRELRGDLKGLSDGVGQQMQSLHDALADSAEARARSLQEQVERLTKSVSELQTRLEQKSADEVGARTEVAAALQRLQTALDSDRAERAALAAAQPAAPAQSVETPALPPAITEKSVEPAAAAVAVAEVATPSAPVAPEPEKPKRSFLAFKLPSETFDFDKTLRFELIPSLSRVGFDAKSTLHDFSGVTSKLEGSLTTCLARPGESCSGAITVTSASLDTGLADRDTEMRANLATDEFKQMRFEWTSFEVSVVDAQKQTVAGTARGKLTIHGVTRDFAMPVRVAVDASKRISIDGEAKLKMSDFEVKVPSKLGVISVEDEIKLWIALRARTAGPAEVKRDAH